MTAPYTPTIQRSTGSPGWMIAASLAFLNPIFAASYYVVSKEALSRYDAIAFTAMETAIVAPVGFFILLWRGNITWQVIKYGILPGCLLAGNLLLNISALRFTTATNTGFYPALIGVIAVIYAAVIQRRRIGKQTWLAAGLSFSGAAYLIVGGLDGAGQWVGDGLAFIGTLVYVQYIYTLENVTKKNGQVVELWCVQVVVVACAAGTMALLASGDRAFVLSRSLDIWIFLYVGIFTTLVPTLIATFAQKRLSPLFTAFLYLLEPIWTAVLAAFYLDERIDFTAYVAGAIIIFGAMVQWHAEINNTKQQR